MASVSVAAAPVWNREETLGPAITAGLALVPFAIAVIGVMTARAGHDAWFSVEDGLAENTQVGLLLAGAVLSGAIAAAWRRRRERAVAALYAALAVALVFLAGEEISWGQRIFGFATPEEFARHNIQHETTLHNTYLFTRVFNLAQLVLGTIAGLVPLLPRRHLVPARYAAQAGALMPPVALAPYFGMTGAWRAYRMVSDHALAAPWVAHYSEVIELVLYLGIFLFVLLKWRAVRTLPV